MIFYYLDASVWVKRYYKEAGTDWKRFIQVQLNDEALNIAKELTKKLALCGADAVHLSSALMLRKRFEEQDDQLIIVTSDYELKEASISSGLKVIDPMEQPLVSS